MTPDSPVTAQPSITALDPPAPTTATKDVTVFFDGECPLCRREIALLRKLDRRNRIGFVDITSEEFDASELGISHAALMAEIHGRSADGSSIKGVEVFRQLYAAVGFSRIVWLTRLPGVAQVLNLGYRLFARNRLKLTGRCSPAE